MRQKSIVPGLKNSQRIRVIVNGVGFYTTVQGAIEMPFTDQRIAVESALRRIASEKITGFGSSTRALNNQNQVEHISYQVDLV